MLWDREGEVNFLSLQLGWLQVMKFRFKETGHTLATKSWA